ncbi:MAG: esterase family protein [Gemmatimonadales bacterium]|nr:esterase family protein [Gemmatimonadales bacterium]
MKLAHGAAVGALVLVATGAHAGAQEPSPRSLQLKSEVFGNTRNLRVLLPIGYDAPENAARRYPVFYFTDGIAAWNAWGVPAVVKELWGKGTIPAFIFVGIDNGGSTAESKAPVRDRASEYLPYPDQTWVEAPPEPRGERFPKFLFDEVMPLVNGALRTAPAGGCTGLAGASYGAAIALYTAMKHPSRFGFLLLESPSLHIGDGRLLKDAAATAVWPQRVYIGAGTAEGDTPEAQSRMTIDANTLRGTLDRAAPRPSALLTIKEGAKHWYDAWNERLPGALTFLLSGDKGARCAEP